MKQIQILDKGNSKFRLTITPERITIKLQKDSTADLQHEVIGFCKRVCELDSLVACTQSFRGGIVVGRGKISIILTNDSKNPDKTIRYSEDR